MKSAPLTCSMVAGRPSRSRNSVEATESSTYTANGRLATVTDGEENRTTYVHDGHDRLVVLVAHARAAPADELHVQDVAAGVDGLIHLVGAEELELGLEGGANHAEYLRQIGPEEARQT